jgi:hypothetical protein
LFDPFFLCLKIDSPKALDSNELEEEEHEVQHPTTYKPSTHSSGVLNCENSLQHQGEDNEDLEEEKLPKRQGRISLQEKHKVIETNKNH